MDHSKAAGLSAMSGSGSQRERSRSRGSPRRSAPIASGELAAVLTPIDVEPAAVLTPVAPGDGELHWRANKSVIARMIAEAHARDGIPVSNVSSRSRRLNIALSSGADAADTAGEVGKRRPSFPTQLYRVCRWKGLELGSPLPPLLQLY